MMHRLLSLALVLLPASAAAAGGSLAMPDLPLIPAPAAWSADGGRLEVAGLDRIVLAGDDRGALRQAGLLADWWHDALGRRLPVQVAGAGAPPTGAVVLRLTGGGPDAAPAVPGAVDETATLELAPDGVVVTATAPAGLFRGIVAVRQLALAAAAGAGPAPTGRARLAPRCRWRGMLLDSGRHRQEPAAIEDVIDRLALYGFNVLHWHLTEDQGWRLDVPDRPRLTDVGAWRTETDGSRYGGFYTAGPGAPGGGLRRRAVRHRGAGDRAARPRHRRPGLLPGAGLHRRTLRGGDPVGHPRGRLLRRQRRGLRPPGRRLRPGGAAVPARPTCTSAGTRCPRTAGCPAPAAGPRIRDEGLADADDLQSWFVGRAGRLLADRGRRLVGWDEILDGGLPPGATVQSWRGTAGAVAAVTAGHDAIVSPTSHAYFDYDPGPLPLEQVLTFDPVPPGLAPGDAAHVLGGEMNLWTEYVPPERIDRQLFPRAAAMAEALVAPAGAKDLASFLDRLAVHETWWPRLGIAPGAAARPVALTVATEPDGRTRVAAGLTDDARRLLDGVAAGVALATVPRPDGWRPDDLAEAQLALPDGAWRVADAWVGEPAAPTLVAARLLVRTAAGTVRPWGAPAVAELVPSLVRGRTPVLTHAPSPRYPGRGAQPLTDGALGSRDFRDGRWVGFEGADLDAAIDLGAPTPVAAVEVRALQDANAWIFLPRELVVEGSDDGVRWRELGRAGHDVPDREQRKVIRTFAVPVDATVRHLRVVAANAGPCPAWHPGRGGPSWIFVDEVTVR